MPELPPANRLPSAAAPGLLRAGPLDIIGDVHGELDALLALLDCLGYRPDGSHADWRSLAFVGDLCDRGPDSPGVVGLVAQLVDAGRAQCVLGNHELNLLRGSPKPGNGWFFSRDHDRERGKFSSSRQATDEERQHFPVFFSGLPLTLERPDLRIVHAAWHPESLQTLRVELGQKSVLEAYRAHAEVSELWAKSSAVAAAAQQEYREWSKQLVDENTTVPLLPAMGRMDEHFQMSNPVRVLTSGVERLAHEAFYASGKWRMVDRVAWWHDYQDDIPVLFGHYWRWASPGAAQLYSRGERDLFAGVAPAEWVGPRRTAYCVDFSAGVRYRERPLPAGQPFLGRLAAVRWPERELVFDDGERQLLVA